MRRNYFLSRNRDALLEPCDGKLSRTVLRGESPRKGADLLDTHVVIVDVGNSYKGLCELIHQKTGGEDGIYFTYTEKHPISFNPFYTDDGVFDIEKKESIKTLILTLWKRDDEPPTRAEEVALSNAVNLYIGKLKRQEVVPGFNTFYEYVKTEYADVLKQKQVREKDFDLANCAPVKAA